MKNTKPILFSTPMVTAIQEDLKTQTRRIIFKDSPRLNAPDIICTGFTDGKHIAHFQGKGSLTSAAGENPKYQPGDILWVRETWSLFGWDYMEGFVNIQYKDQTVKHFYPDVDNIEDWIGKKIDKLEKKGLLETDPDDEERVTINGKLWEPSIFMPKWAARIFLEVTDVRVERLQDISEEDAKAEGAEPFALKFARSPYFMGFYHIWANINGEDSWKANSWVWVYDFKKVEKPANFE